MNGVHRFGKEPVGAAAAEQRCVAGASRYIIAGHRGQAAPDLWPVIIATRNWGHGCAGCRLPACPVAHIAVLSGLILSLQ